MTTLNARAVLLTALLLAASSHLAAKPVDPVKAKASAPADMARHAPGNGGDGCPKGSESNCTVRPGHKRDNGTQGAGVKSPPKPKGPKTLAEKPARPSP